MRLNPITQPSAFNNFLSSSPARMYGYLNIYGIIIVDISASELFALDFLRSDTPTECIKTEETEEKLPHVLQLIIPLIDFNLLIGLLRLYSYTYVFLYFKCSSIV